MLTSPVDLEPRRPSPTVLRQFASAPLVPFAVAVTLGILSDRYFRLPLEVSLVVAVISVLLWLALPRWKHARHAFLLAVAALGSGYHHFHQNIFPPDDIGVSLTTKPAVLLVRGTILEPPETRKIPVDPMQPARRKDRDFTIIEVNSVRNVSGNWNPASGRLRLTVDHDTETALPMRSLQAGDTVEVVGLASVPEAPSNPGESDYRQVLKDQRVRGELRVSDGSTGVVRMDEAEFGLTSTLSAIRGRATRILSTQLPKESSPTARALLLADGSAMERMEWDSYIRTGVVHVLAISGQHLVVLAGFVWIVASLFGLQRHQAAWLVLVIIVLYAMVTGLRPSAVRAAVMVFAVCGATVLRRPVHVANAFAFAWIVVLALNPADVFNLGCKLSFLSVFVLIWGVARWLTPGAPPPEERLLEIFRPLWLKVLRAVLRAVAVAYLVNLILFIVNTPMLVAEQNIVSPIGLLIGPVLVLLTSIALVAGFLLFVFAAVPGVAEVLVFLTHHSLEACAGIVTWADSVPLGAVYLPGLPMWWLTVYYAIVASFIFWDAQRKRLIFLGLAWVFLLALLPTRNLPDGELRATFLSVGHGACTVIETPDGRVLLYDVGTLSGPDSVRRVIAPYLWHRGIRRIDEVFLSHADSDHFNNLPELLRRFPVGRVSLTPSFALKPSKEVAETLLALEKHKIDRRLVTSGETLSAGDVEIEVLHPPPDGPAGTENERSLVLLLKHGGHTILLTGDLEGAGTSRVVQLQTPSIDVLCAPHHGSPSAWTPAFKRWAKPKFVVFSRGSLFGAPIQAGDAGPNVAVWNTHDRGAVTVKCHQAGLVVEAFKDGEKRVVGR